MIELHNFKNNAIDIIYENKNEIIEYNVPVKPLEEVDIGDYIHTDNGFYVPVLKIVPMSKFTNKHTGITFKWFKFQFPRMEFFSRLYLNTGTFERKALNWYRDYAIAHKKKSINPTEKYFATLLGMGIELFTAYKIAFPEKQIYRTLIAIFENEVFVNYLREKNIMSELIKQFKKEGIDQLWFAKQVKSAIEGYDADTTLKVDPKLRMWAMNYLGAVFNDTDNSMIAGSKTLPDGTQTSMIATGSASKQLKERLMNED